MKRGRTMRETKIYLTDEILAMLDQVIEYRYRMFGVKVSRSELMREILKEGLERKLAAYKQMLGKDV